MSNWANWKNWVHGLAAAAISSFATAASGAIISPTVFSLDLRGFENMVKLSIPPALLAVFLYLKESPIPPLSGTVDEKGNVTLSGSPVVEVSLEGQKKQ